MAISASTLSSSLLPLRLGGAGLAAAAAAAKPAPPKRKGKSELDKVEAEIATVEARLAQLEEKLAVDWGDVDLIAGHKRTRDELAALMLRWEALFEEAQAGAEA